ncbi:MAG: hypothetical protein AYK19_14130 [Theionarchaea archaeon DG-70-1]|nr:MAG: hypothetical protein AYK19_14130 [Theionarchaea archaeon DG-70-1]
MVLVVLAGCIDQGVFGEEEKKEWIDVATPIAENILQSMNEGDYVGFTKDFSEGMKEAMTLQKFVDLKGRLESTVGKYISSSPAKAIERGEYVAVYFSAKFRNEENIPVEISFKKDDKAHKVYGLWFPPEIPENNDEQESTLENLIRWLESDPLVRLIGIIATFIGIPAAIINITKLLTRKKEEK